MSKVAKWIFPAAGGKDGIIGTAKAVVGIMTGNWGMIAAGVAQVAGLGKKSQGQARQASVLQLTLGETPREAVLGLTCTGGSLVDVFNFGGQYGTDKVTRCVALADHLIDGIVGFYIDDKYYPWVGDGLQAAFGNKLSFHFRNASAVGHEPPQHVRENGGWAASDRMVGIAHIWIDWFVDEKVWPQGHPAIRFVLRGLRAYDPRFDPQFGYSGPNPQTWDNPASHKFTRNAKVLRYAYTRGIYAEGHHSDPNYLLIGRGLSADEAPPEAVIADANLCDEIVDGVARYTVGGVISAAQPFIDVDGMFAAAMAGVIVQREGTVDVEAGQAKAVVVTITDADLVGGEPVSFSRFLPDNDGGRINTVMGRYIEPSLGYKDHSAPVRRSLTDIQADGGPREQTISLPLVDQVKQVDRIIEIHRLLGRLERRASIVLPPKFAGLEEGDWIAWQSDRRHGGATVRYRIETYRQPETWRMYLTLREIASSAFGVPDPIADPVRPPSPPTPLDALALTGVLAEAITLAADPAEPVEGEPAPAGSTVPAIRFKWDVLTPPPEGEEGEPTEAVDAAIRAIRAEVRVVGGDDVAPTRTEDVRKGVLVTTNGVGANQTLEARLVPIGEPWRPVLPSAWFTVTTGALIAGGLSPESPDWDEIRAVGGTAAAEAETRLQAALDAAKSQLEAADAMTASALLAADTRLTDALNGKASNATVTALQSQADGLSAWRVTAQQVLTDLPNNYASASSVTGLQSEVTAARSGSPNLLARLTADRQVVTDGLAGKASASDLTALTSRMTTAESVNTAQNTRLNTVETDLAGKASSTALATLSSEVTGARNGSATLGAQLTAMRQTVVDGLAGKAASSDLNNLTATVTSQGTAISGHSTRLTTVESNLAGKASASDLTSLSSVVNLKTRTFRLTEEPPNPAFGLPLVAGDRWINPALNNEERIWAVASQSWVPITDPRIAATASTVAAHASRLTTVETDVAGKASATALSTLSSEVTTARNGSPSLAAQLTSMRQTVTDGLAGKASTTDVTTLTSRVGTAEATLTAVGSTAADAQSKLAEARFALIAAASGGNPARFGLVSGQHGSSLALDADQIWFGPNTFFQKATWTLRTTVGTTRYVEAWGPPFGGTDSLTYWRGPSSVADGAERKNNVGNGAWEDSTGDSFFGGSTLTGFFSTTPSASAIVLGTGWTDVASFEIPTRQGWFAMFSGLDVRGSGQWLVPKEPEWPNAPEPRVDVRAVSTDPGGGDVIELAIGQVTGSLVNTTWINSVWSAHRIASNVRSGRRRLVLQARRSADTAIERTTYAEARNGMMQAYYMLGNAPGTGSVPPTPPAGQQLVGVTEDPSIYLTVPI